jgi:type IV pilus assembly protein PilQ
MRGFFSSPAGAPARGSSPARPVRLLSALALAALFSFGQQARVEAADLALERMEVVGGEVPQLVLFLSDAAQGSAVSSYPQTQPDRVVVELAGTITNMGVSQVAGDGVLVDRAEVISFDDGTGPTTRVTLYLTRPGAEVQPLVVSDGNRVVVSLNPVRSAGEATAEATPRERNPRDLSGPERVAAGPALTSLDFESLDEVSRVVIGLKDTREYTVTQSQGNLILVDIPGTFLPQSLQRVLDTGDFVSPVRMVRAYKTGRGTRVAISLRRETTYEHTITDRGLLVLDIKVPPGMTRERENARSYGGDVSPGRPDGGLGNAVGGEVGIGSNGRSFDPGSAWGRGGGSYDPSSAAGLAAGFMYDNSGAGNLPYSGQRISLDFVNADIHSIFRLISHVSRLNIVASDDVEGEVTVRMTDVPWDQALAAILQAKGLGSQRFGSVVRVAPIETIKAEQQAKAETVEAMFKSAQLELLVVPLNYVQASDINKQLTSLLTSRGTLQVDQTSNQLIIKDIPANLPQLRELIRYMDRETPQVLIEARVVEASTNYTRSMGIQWGGELDATTSTGYSTGLFFPNGVGMSGGISSNVAAANRTVFYQPGQDTLLVDLGAEATSSSVAFSLGSIPGVIDLDARLSALEQDGWGKVISQPRITTLDNKPATVAQGQRVPFLSTSAGGTAVQFINAVLSLTVTPHITQDNKIFMRMKIENNRADFSRLVQGQPAIQIKEIETELLVADGDTTVMGGVFSTEQTYSQNRTPGFSKLPLLGYLFKNATDNMSRNELLVFVTPHIVTRPQSSSSRR